MCFQPTLKAHSREAHHMSNPWTYFEIKMHLSEGGLNGYRDNGIENEVR